MLLLSQGTAPSMTSRVHVLKARFLTVLPTHHHLWERWQVSLQVCGLSPALGPLASCAQKVKLQRTTTTTTTAHAKLRKDYANPHVKRRKNQQGRMLGIQKMLQKCHFSKSMNAL